MKKFLKRMLIAFSVVLAYLAASLIGPFYVYWTGQAEMSRLWHEADRSRTGIAPNPADHEEALVQIYTARAFSWRGIFAVHPWIAVKPKGAKEYTVIHILSWKLNSSDTSVSISQSWPDQKWYGNDPEIVFSAEGSRAEKIIAEVERLIPQYPFHKSYKAYPGPNSNTFVAYLINNIKEIDVPLPPTAIGQRYPTNGMPIDFGMEPFRASLSFWGHLGLVVGKEEGVRFFLFGVEWGVNPWKLQLIVPGVGLIDI